MRGILGLVPCFDGGLCGVIGKEDVIPGVTQLQDLVLGPVTPTVPIR